MGAPPVHATVWLRISRLNMCRAHGHTQPFLMKVLGVLTAHLMLDFLT